MPLRPIGATPALPAILGGRQAAARPERRPAAPPGPPGRTTGPEPAMERRCRIMPHTRNNALHPDTSC
ncbi:MAG: hypothetical protein KIT69_07275 [Propionibacteriaceae bacterium]|nr:hypothetical protein [Propionibacteriaceae bacterium]